MKAQIIIAAAVPLLLASGVALSAAYALPEERVITLPPGPGADLATAHCAACHSLDYLTTQPPGLGEKKWASTISKMVDVYGADIPAQDRATIAAYLNRVVGTR